MLDVRRVDWSIGVGRHEILTAGTFGVRRTLVEASGNLSVRFRLAALQRHEKFRMIALPSGQRVRIDPKLVGDFDLGEAEQSLSGDPGLFPDLDCEHPAKAAIKRRLAHMAPSSLCGRLAGRCPGRRRPGPKMHPENDFARDATQLLLELQRREGGHGVEVPVE
jgi:hypothetical protein